MYEAYQNQVFPDARLGIDCITNYPEAVQWLLPAYATEGLLSKATDGVEAMKQGQTETESQFALRLRLAAMSC